MDTHQGRLSTLDGLRGIAAVLVLLMHFDNLVVLAPSGYLAVDFFFALSGLVVARAYGPRLAAGWPALMFLRARLIRFYPLFAIGLLFGLIRAISQILVHQPTALSSQEVATSFFLGLFFLPSYTSLSPLFPLNGPAWSLFFELIVNSIFAVFIIKLSRRVVITITVLFFIAVCIGSDNVAGAGRGGSWSEAGFGLCRTMLSFNIGMLFAQPLKMRFQTASFWFVLPVLALISILTFSPSTATHKIYDLMCIGLLLPAILWIGAIFNPPAGLVTRAASWLGDISYPLYITHYSLIFMASYVARKLNWRPGLWIIGFIFIVLALSSLLARYVDPRLRFILARWLMPKRSALITGPLDVAREDAPR